MNIVMIGLGNVGKGLLSLLLTKDDALKKEYGFAPRIVGVVTGSRGTLYTPDGLDITTLLACKTLADYPDMPTLARDWSAERIIRESLADVVVEASPSNFETAQPALSYCYAALESGKHLVLANKGPVALDYAGLKARAEAAGVRLYFEGTVMAGTPAIRLAAEALKGSRITHVRGILNGTTNYMLTLMEDEGMSYADALSEAQAMGYAETDPSGDVEGWDAAGKAVILAAAVFGQKLTLAEMDVEGITALTPDAIAAAAAAGERWKLIAELTSQGASVRPVRLPLSHPLAGVSGATNAITYTTDVLGDVTLIGAGAGRTETGYALLADLLALQDG